LLTLDTRMAPPTTVSATAWNQAVAAHQAGRFQEAEALYRQILAAAPRHFDAQHLLGVVALQTSRLDEAEQLLSAALTLNPKFAAAHNNLGNVHLRQGRSEAALACFQKAVQLQPSYADAHFNAGNLQRVAGRLREAAQHFQRAAAGNAKWLEAQLNLGATLLDLGDTRGAVKAFETAVRLKPDHVDALSNLGAALLESGELQRARETLARALKIDPRSVGARMNEGIVLARLGLVDAARQALGQAARSAPDHPAVPLNLGTLLHESGLHQEAIAQFERAASLDATSIAARSGLALALQATGRTQEAQACCQALLRDHPDAADALLLQGRLNLARHDPAGAEAALRAAVAAQPGNAQALYELGHLHMQAGRWRDALHHYQRATQADPSHVQARWALVMAQIPPVPASAAEAQKARAQFARMLGELDKWFDSQRTAQGHRAVGSTQPFYLAYDGSSHREPLQKYGALCARLVAPWQADNQLRPGAAAAHRPLRVGIASAHLHDHSVWNALVKGWVRHLDRQRFALHLYHLGERRDAQTELARQWAHRFEIGPRPVMQWARAILSDEIDVLIYPEIGMDATTTQLASMRLARVQAASWGHPETSGLPTIDHYLSAQDLEPPDAAKHYTEQLVALPHLGSCYEPEPPAHAAVDLRALGLPQDRPLLLCPGMPFKYAPAQDRVWSEIARRAPLAHLVFFQPAGSEAGAQLAQRLEQHFAAAGVGFHDRVSFIPFLDRERYHGLMQQAHLMLDSIGFSGFNTAMQALECALPVVAHEGCFLRGRLASGLLRRLGLDELVAASDDDYIDRAVQLAGDPAQRQRCSQQIVERRARLLGDTTPVRALEDFLERSASGVSAGQPSG